MAARVKLSPNAKQRGHRLAQFFQGLPCALQSQQLQQSCQPFRLGRVQIHLPLEEGHLLRHLVQRLPFALEFPHWKEPSHR